jgi:hypothetical protein
VFTVDKWSWKLRKIALLKGEATLVEGWTGPEGSRKLRLPDFMTVIAGRW